jgi:hypothetical protein
MWASVYNLIYHHKDKLSLIEKLHSEYATLICTVDCKNYKRGDINKGK